MTPLLFLDVDGVLNKRENFNPALNPGPYPVDSYCTFLAGKIQLDTNCAVVVSSAWRHSREGMAEISRVIPNVIGKTPSGSQLRGDEIKAWLDAHPGYGPYAILDDDSDMLPEQLPNFFQTTFDDGLTEDIAKAVTAHLLG